MKEMIEHRISIPTGLLMVLLASAAVTAPSAHARAANSTIVVPPSQLPPLARQSGEAMFLHATGDGRTLLYIERERGSRLAILDVTDPRRIKDDGSVQTSAPGPFDFVAALGDRAELVRFRQDHASAVLDLHQATLPRLKPATPAADNLPPEGEEIVNPVTDTSFVLTDSGLYLIRRPDAEMTRQFRDTRYDN